MPGRQRVGILAIARGRMIWAMFLGAAILLSACGGDDKDKATPTPTQGATVAAPTSASGGDTSGTTPTVAAEATFDMTAIAATSTAQVAMINSFEGKIDACKLVSRKAAEKIIGGKLSGDPFKGIEGMEQAKSFCNYNPESVPGTAVVTGTTIQLVVFTEDDLKALGMGDDIEKFWNDTKASAQEGEGFAAVDGLGDDAFFSSDNGLSVRKGDKLIAVQGLPQDQAKEFVKKAIDNL